MHHHSTPWSLRRHLYSTSWWPRNWWREQRSFQSWHQARVGLKILDKTDIGLAEHWGTVPKFRSEPIEGKLAAKVEGVPPAKVEVVELGQEEPKPPTTGGGDHKLGWDCTALNPKNCRVFWQVNNLPMGTIWKNYIRSKILLLSCDYNWLFIYICQSNISYL